MSASPFSVGVMICNSAASLVASSMDGYFLRQTRSSNAHHGVGSVFARNDLDCHVCIAHEVNYRLRRIMASQTTSTWTMLPAEGDC